jgi:hypothetical protein
MNSSASVDLSKLATSEARRGEEPVYFRLTGGVGNQLFQWVAAVAFHRRTSLPVSLVTPSPPGLWSRWRRLREKGYWTRHFERSLDTYFDVCRTPGVTLARRQSIRSEATTIVTARREEIVPGYFRETFDAQIFAARPGTRIEGWLQDIRYFDFLIPELPQLIVPRRDPRRKIERLERTLGASLRDCVAIHVRRGDYWTIRHPVRHPLRGWVLPTSYYERACERLAADDYALALVVSDAKPSELADDLSFLKRPVLLQTGSVPLDFAVLSRAGACVIANSTFSWWAAMLNQTACGRIAAPEFFLGWAKKVWLPGGLRVDGWQWISVE